MKRNPRVLTYEQARHIRRLYKGDQRMIGRREGMTLDEIAEMYGVGRTTVYRIVHFKTYTKRR